MPTGTTPTAHEQLVLQEILRVEAAGVDQTRSMLPMIADPELRQSLETCVSTGTTHIKALLDFCRSHQLVH